MDHSLLTPPAQLRATGRGSGVLWLCCAEGDERRLLKRLRTAGARSAGPMQAVKWVYYDTRRQKLLRAGYRLSVRSQGGKRFQDIEAVSPATLAPAICWTTEIEDDAPCRTSLARTPLEGILGGAAAERLKPAFVVDMRRRFSFLDREAASLAVSFDAGTIEMDGVAQSTCELRLELAGGALANLFDLARELGSAVPLTLSLRPPGERGLRLLPARPGHPVGDRSGDIRDEMTTREAADGICRSCAAALLDGLAQLSSGEGQDALHRTRIGVRRLRALLWFLKPVLGLDVAILSGRLRSLARFLGGARELDVFCDRLLAPLQRDNPDAPGVDALFETFDRRRQEAHEQVLAFVRSPAMLDFGLDLVRDLAASSVSEPPGTKARQLRERPVAAFVQERLHSRLKAFLKKSRKLQHCPADRQHDIRIEAKKLRYAVEAFHQVIGAKRSRKLAAGLVHLQDLLGELNDARTGHAIALDYARERAGHGDGEPALFAAGLAAAACTFDPTATLSKVVDVRDELAAAARQMSRRASGDRP